MPYLRKRYTTKLPTLNQLGHWSAGTEAGGTERSVQRQVLRARIGSAVNGAQTAAAHDGDES